MRLKVVSLFSGAGGLDWGFATTDDYEIIFANDVLESACITYSRNFGLRFMKCKHVKRVEATEGTVLACDVAQVDFSGLKRLDVDVVIAGPPCQDFSIVRGPEWDRKGIEVRRGRLYAHFVRALVQLQPKAFVFENVPGLVSANKGKAYEMILGDLSKLNVRWDDVKREIGFTNSNTNITGYEIVFSGIIDFSKFGVPQKRERLIVVGIRKDLTNNEMELKEIVKKYLAQNGVFVRYPLVVIEVFEGKTIPELQEIYEKSMKEWDNVWLEVNTPRAWQWKQEVWDKLTFDIVKDYVKAIGVKNWSEYELEEVWREHRAVLEELGYYGSKVCERRLPDGTCDLPNDAPKVKERMKRIPPGENHEFVKGTKWGVEGKGISLIYRRLHPLKPSYTIVAYGGGGTHGYHYEKSRATLSLRERARLQTFPDSFLLYGSKAEIRAQIGEAVPPLASKKIAETLKEIFELII